MKTKKHDAIVLSSGSEKNAEARIVELLHDSPLPHDEVLSNLGLFLTSKNLARLLFFCEIYKKISGRHGLIVEFGVRWGQTLALLSSLRGIFEPFNRHRKIIGFDTFGGFCGLSAKDGKRNPCRKGSFSVSSDYERYLEEVLALHEALNPMSHIRRFELIKGDAVRTVPSYFRKHPETMVTLAIFDFDIYAPTKAALKAIKPCLSKGSILVFDELCDDIFPGETVALKETLGLSKLEVKRLPMASRLSYIEV